MGIWPLHVYSVNPIGLLLEHPSFHFASTAVVVDSSHMTASSSALWSRFSPLQILLVCLCQQCGSWSDAAIITRWWLGKTPFVQVCMTWALTCPETFSRDHVRRQRSKPGCWIVGSVTVVWLITEPDDQSSLHCVTVSTDVMSDHIGRQNTSLRGGWSKASAYSLDGLSMIWSTPKLEQLQAPCLLNRSWQ